MLVPPRVTHRIAKSEDLPLLIRYREECGWGVPAVLKGMKDPDRIYCIFRSEIDGQIEDVGMGCWYLHQPDDLELACRDKQVIHLASLFISVKYQGRKIGSEALDLLERVAVLELGAKSVTLDTTAYFTTFVQPEGGGPKYVVEDPTRQGRTVAWYQARGYRQFRDHRKLFPHPLPDDPDRLLTAIFMEKSAEAIRSEQ